MRLLKITVFILLVGLASCHNPHMVSLSGPIMGTTYNVKFITEDSLTYQNEIHQLLMNYNDVVSTYVLSSDISKFNHDSLVFFSADYMHTLLSKSREVYHVTGHAFDPTVMPLVNLWGFGPAPRMGVDTSQVDGILPFIGFDKIFFDKEKAWKSDARVQLDFSAVAKGYGSDIVVQFLEEKGITDIMVEIGGELSCKGLNLYELPWKVGVTNPSDEIEGQVLISTLLLEDRAMATSGNYRNYYIKDGNKYAHTINPSTGFPIQSDILSATVIADDCMTADAYATAFMVVGLEKAVKISTQNKSLEVYFIYVGNDNEMKEYISPSLQDKFAHVEY